MVVWTSSAAAGAASAVSETGLTLGGGSGGAVATGAGDGVSATGSTLGGGLGGGSRHLTLIMLSVVDLFSSFPRLYEASIWVHLGRGMVTLRKINFTIWFPNFSRSGVYINHEFGHASQEP